MPAPSVDAAAFGGHGELAFVSRGRLWVLDGVTGTLRRVLTRGVTPLDPAFSPDGRWLAFLGSSASPSATYALWIASGDGRGAHQIRGLAAGELIGWSPVADVLAVTAGPQSARMPYGAPATVRLVAPPGSVRTLMSAAGIQGAVWSPDGSRIAVATTHWPTATTLASYPVAGGKPVTWLRLNAKRGVLDGMTQVIIDPAGWWPRWGIGFWAFGNGMVHNLDQTPLNAIAAPGARPRLLGYTLSDASAPQAAAAPDGWLAIVNNTNSGLGRVIWQGKHVETCYPANAACAAVPWPPSAVTLDPAWSPDGTELAFVRAPSRASPGFPQHAVAAWYGAHQLWVYTPAPRPFTQKLDAAGASVPAWSFDGRSLLYVARDAIWLLPQLTLTGRPVRIAGPLFPPGDWPSYYGQVTWASQFAWWSGSSPAALSPGPAPGVTPGVALFTPADSANVSLYLAYTAADGAVYVRNVLAPLQPTVALGGHLIGGPAVVLTPPSVLSAQQTSTELAVFGRGPDNALWWIHQTPSGWTRWQCLGGNLSSKPAAVATSFGGDHGKLAVFARGTDGAIWYRGRGTRGWAPWARLGGHLLPGTAPAAVYDGNGHLVVAAVGTDRHVWLLTRFERSGFTIRDLGGRTASDPGIAFVWGTRQAPNTSLAVVFVRGPGNALWYKQTTLPVNTVNGAWRSLGGILTSGVAAVSVGLTYVFALGTDNQAWYRGGGWPSLGAWTRA